MKSKYFIALGCLISATTFFACTKHDGDVEEPIPTATLTFLSPTTGAIYHTGDSVLIQGLAAASAEMHGYEVSVRNASDTSIVYFSQEIDEHSDSLLINLSWKDTLTTAINLQVEVTLVLDHDGHTTTKSVDIKSETK